tara:strand:+ start:365 stop:1390 length:1026 start_codon:yes stop_codon:yes gene_type:complete
MSNSSKLLTIAIPTKNRHEYLEENLKSLNDQYLKFKDKIEILVSDNSSNNFSKIIIDKYNKLNLDIVYIKNSRDIGSDKNIAQCFNMANGKYVHIIGDDDIYFSNSLGKLVKIIEQDEYGSIFLRPYGFTNDYKKEYPPNLFRKNAIYNCENFLLKIATQITLLSAHVINKSLIKDIDASNYCGTNLVQVNLLMDAVTKSNKNYYFKEYIIAYKRDNSGGYDFYDIFINKFNEILQLYVNKGLITKNLKERIECKKIKCFFPIYLFRYKYYQKKNIKDIENSFEVLKKNKCYKRFINPIFKLPSFFSLIWCVAMIIYGRLLNGDAPLGLAYIKRQIREKIL